MTQKQKENKTEKLVKEFNALVDKMNNNNEKFTGKDSLRLTEIEIELKKDNLK